MILAIYAEKTVANSLISESRHHPSHVHPRHTLASCRLCVSQLLQYRCPQTSAPEIGTHTCFVLLLRKLRPWEVKSFWQILAQLRSGNAEQSLRTPDASPELCPYVTWLSERKPRLIHLSLAFCLMFITSITCPPSYWFPAFCQEPGSVLDAETARDGKN